jgi:DNA-binding beta-propeller fold protein YncE
MLQRLIRFIASLVFVSGAGLLAYSASFGDNVPAYDPVPNWMTVPDGFQFGLVTAVATDKHDNVFVFHRGKQPIAVFDKHGKFLRSWGDGAVKTAHGLRLDADGNVWTTDLGTHQVIKYDPTGKVLLTLGKKNQPGETPEQFDRPADIAIARMGDVYIADGYGNSRVVKFSRDGKFLKTWGKRGKATGEFHLVHAIVVDAMNRVYVGDRENDRVQVFDSDGKFLAEWRDSGAPYGLFLQDGSRMLVADGRGNEVRILDIKGKLLSRFGAKGQGVGQFRMPHGICADSRGVVYVAEGDGKRLQKFVAH